MINSGEFLGPNDAQNALFEAESMLSANRADIDHKVNRLKYHLGKAKKGGNESGAHLANADIIMRDLEPRKGQFDYEKLDSKLAKMWQKTFGI